MKASAAKIAGNVGENGRKKKKGQGTKKKKKKSGSERKGAEKETPEGRGERKFKVQVCALFPSTEG